MTNQNKPKVSIVILDFLKSRRVCENVESIQKQITNFDFEVIIVDNSVNKENADKIKTLEKFDNVKIYINEENLGYIGGTNQGVEKAQGEYLMIVNPDIIWGTNDTLQKFVDYMEANPDVGVCGPKQINDDTNTVAMSVRAYPNFFLQAARRTWLRNLPIIKDLVAYDEMQHLNYDLEQDVDWLQSSFWITRRSLWNEIGGLDKDYFIFMSDPEYCFQTWKRGFKVMYNPDLIVYADGKRASAGGFLDFFKKRIIRIHTKDALFYQAKHLFDKNPRIEFHKKAQN